MVRRRFSTGKHAYLIDDRTGRKIRYQDARTEWTGARVHKSEWEEKHPQLTPPRAVTDAQSLKDPRPDSDDMTANVDFRQVGRSGVKTIGHVGSISTIFLWPNPTGMAGTMTLGSESPQITLNVASPSGLSGTGTLGSEGLELKVDESSFAMTASLGTGFAVQLPEWGMGAWGDGTWSY